MSMPVTLWLFMGVVAAVALVWTAYTSFRKNNEPAVEGSSENQQQEADSLRLVLAQDSTNVPANIALANVLYDTANWAQAIPYYARAIARDSSRVEAIVDMGVCYYNQGDVPHAEQLFNLALAHDPHQPVALFNLGVVAERRDDSQGALKYYHRALESGPPDEMKTVLVQKMQALLKKTGQVPPPLEQGGTPGMPPGQTPPPGGGK